MEQIVIVPIVLVSWAYSGRFTVPMTQGWLLPYFLSFSVSPSLTHTLVSSSYTSPAAQTLGFSGHSGYTPRR